MKSSALLSTINSIVAALERVFAVHHHIHLILYREENIQREQMLVADVPFG